MKEKDKKVNGETQEFSPKEVGRKLGGITPQAVIKKIHNTLLPDSDPKKKKTNVLPDGLVVKQYGRIYVVTAPANFVWPKTVKTKRAKRNGKARKAVSDGGNY